MAHNARTEHIALGPCSFPPLTLPPCELNWRINPEGTSVSVQCVNRKKWVALTPEEWVRQHWLQHLSSELGYPMGLISVEHPVKLNGMSRFADIVCHDRSGQPLMLLELKRPTVALSKRTLDQVLRYHLTMHTPVVVISNGIQHQGFRFENGDFHPLKTLAPFT